MAEMKITGDTSNITQAMNDLTKALKDFKGATTETGKASEKAAEAATNKWTEFASKLDVIGKVKDALNWVKENVQAMESLQTQFTALSLFDSSGKFRKVLNETLVLTKGVANEYDLIGTTNKLVQQGFDLTEQQFRDLIDVSARYASVIGVDVNSAIETMSIASLKEKEGLMRKFGVQIDMNKALDDYAKKLGTTIDGMSEAERQTAILNEQVSALKTAFDAKGINNEALMSPISTAMKQMDTLTMQMTDKIIAQMGVIATAPVTRLLIKVMGSDADKKQLQDLERQVRLNDMIVKKYGEGLSDKQKNLLLEKETLLNEQKKRDTINEQKEQIEKGLIAQHQGDLVSQKTNGNIRAIKDQLKKTRENDDLYQTFKKANISTDAMAQHLRMMKIDMELMLANASKMAAGFDLFGKKFKDDEAEVLRKIQEAKERAERIKEANKKEWLAAEKAKDELREKVLDKENKLESEKLKKDGEKFTTQRQRLIDQMVKLSDIESHAEKKRVIDTIDREKQISTITSELAEKAFDAKWSKMIDFEKKYNTDLGLSGEQVDQMTKDNLDERLEVESVYQEERTKLVSMGTQAISDFSAKMINDVLLGEKEFSKEMIGDFSKMIGQKLVDSGTFNIFEGLVKMVVGDTATGSAQMGIGVAEVGAGIAMQGAAKAIGTTSSSESKSKETASNDRINTNNNGGRDQMQVYLYPSEKYYLRTHNRANNKLGYKKGAK